MQGHLVFIVEPVIICTHRGTVGGFCWGVSSRVTQPLRAKSVNLFSDFTIKFALYVCTFSSVGASVFAWGVSADFLSLAIEKKRQHL